MAAPPEDVVPVELHVVSDRPVRRRRGSSWHSRRSSRISSSKRSGIPASRPSTISSSRSTGARAARGGRLHARPPRAQTGDADSVPPRAPALLRPARPPDRLGRPRLGARREHDPGRRHPLDSTYFRRMEAMEFAVKYDDGMGAGLEEADIVLVGVSRTSKTPLSIYLGYLGYKTANVPIVKGIDPPPELFEIDPAKIVGLTLEASRLAEIRQARLRHMGSSKRQYAEPPRSTRSSSRRRGPAPPRLPGDRGVGALDRGDRAPHHSPGEPAARGGRGLLSTAPKEPVPLWRWGTWTSRSESVLRSSTSS